jgi:hypothetical protein
MAPPCPPVPLLTASCRLPLGMESPSEAGAYPLDMDCWHGADMEDWVGVREEIMACWHGAEAEHGGLSRYA